MKNLSEKITHTFQRHPLANTLFSTSDGHVFLKYESATAHGNTKKNRAVATHSREQYVNSENQPIEHTKTVVVNIEKLVTEASKEVVMQLLKNGAGEGTGENGTGEGTGENGTGEGTGENGTSEGTGENGTGEGTGENGTSEGTGENGTGEGTGENGTGEGTGEKGTGEGTGEKAELILPTEANKKEEIIAFLTEHKIAFDPAEGKKSLIAKVKAFAGK